MTDLPQIRSWKITNDIVHENKVIMADIDTLTLDESRFLNINILIVFHDYCQKYGTL